MAGNNAIQILRANSATIANSSETLLDGQLLYNTDKNYLTCGGGANKPVNSLPVVCRELVAYNDDNESISNNTNVGARIYYNAPNLCIENASTVKINANLNFPNDLVQNAIGIHVNTQTATISSYSVPLNLQSVTSGLNINTSANLNIGANNINIGLNSNNIFLTINSTSAGTLGVVRAYTNNIELNAEGNRASIGIYNWGKNGPGEYGYIKLNSNQGVDIITPTSTNTFINLVSSNITLNSSTLSSRANIYIDNYICNINSYGVNICACASFNLWTTYYNPTSGHIDISAGNELRLSGNRGASISLNGSSNTVFNFNGNRVYELSSNSIFINTSTSTSIENSPKFQTPHGNFWLPWDSSYNGNYQLAINDWSIYNYTPVWNDHWVSSINNSCKGLIGATKYLLRSSPIQDTRYPQNKGFIRYQGMVTLSVISLQLNKYRLHDLITDESIQTPYGAIIGDLINYNVLLLPTDNGTYSNSIYGVAPSVSSGNLFTFGVYLANGCFRTGGFFNNCKLSIDLLFEYSKTN